MSGWSGGGRFVEFPQTARKQPRLAAAHLCAVHRHQRQQPGHGVGEKRLLGASQIVQSERDFVGADAGRVGQLEHCTAGDARERAVLDGRRQKFAVPDEEDVGGAPIREATAGVEEERLVQAGAAG